MWTLDDKVLTQARQPAEKQDVTNTKGGNATSDIHIVICFGSYNQFFLLV